MRKGKGKPTYGQLRLCNIQQKRTIVNLMSEVNTYKAELNKLRQSISKK